ncbi:hypothetical protein BVX99_02785 [bacterium F16]|nr:hypothetical protein BVX99_02785 [bacterium F16]
MNAFCHFQVILPPTEILARPQTIQLALMFTHPMANGPIMDITQPQSLGVMIDSKAIDLRSSLTEKMINGRRTYA